MTDRVVLVQPPPGARISGGYLYNTRMAAEGAFELLSLADLSEIAALDADLVLADSIFLREDAFAPFLALAARGRRVGVLLHAFPSFVRAGEAGEPVPAQPSAFELSALQAIGLAVTLGSIYAPLLQAAGVRRVECPPGLHAGLRQAPRPRTGPCELLALGAVTRLKGHADVLDALGEATTDVHFSIYGSLEADADYAHTFLARAARFPWVSVLGQGTPDEVQRALSRANALVMPSHSESHSLVLMEALAASVPSVAYATGASAHIVQDGATGFVVPVGDRAALRDALRRLVDDEPLRMRMAEACFVRGAGLPTWSEAASEARAQLAGVCRNDQ